MSLPKKNPTETQAWQKLREHFYEVQFVKMQDLFRENPTRVNDFNIIWNDFLVDFSKNRITDKTIDLLVQLAEDVDLKTGINALLSGETINETEGRKVLHTDLRKELQNQTEEVAAALNQIEKFTERVISGNLKGSTGKAFTDVINIGIGGSD